MEQQRFPVFAQRFSQLRGERTQGEFADFLGISRPTVGFYENGSRIPDAVVLRQIGEKCGVSTDWLLGMTDTASNDPSIQAVCACTGLSEHAAAILKGLNDDSLGPVAKRYTIPTISILDDLIASNLFLPFLGELGLYFIFGGCLPPKADGGEGPELSIEEIDRFEKWANGHGLAVTPQKEVSEMHLQKACDTIRNIAKSCLAQQLEHLQEQADSH